MARFKSFNEAEESQSGGTYCDGKGAGLVGEKPEKPYGWRYHSPHVTVSAHDEFVTVETDPYEGSAMFHVENLPDVIAMLQAIQASREQPKSG